MSMLDHRSLQFWIARYYESQGRLKPYGLNQFLRLTLWDINPAFMAHMRSRWNPLTRSFHFGRRQICPTIEEFRAIMFIREGKTSLRLKSLADSQSFKAILQSNFGLSKANAARIFKGHVMDLQLWHNLVVHDDKTPDEPWVDMMQATILLAHYFLAPSNGRPSVKVFDAMLHTWYLSYDISGLVLAETIMGLNEPFWGHQMSSRGSPWALYIWLLDKTMCIPPILHPNSASYEEQKARIRQAKPVDRLDDDAPLRGFMPWYRIRTMMYAMEGDPSITLYGLESTTSYLTTCLHAQFGRRYMPLTLAMIPPADAPITMAIYKRFNDLRALSASLAVPAQGPSEALEDYISDPSASRKRPRDQYDQRHQDPDASPTSSVGSSSSRTRQRI